jgi:predicted esterase
VQKTKRLRVAMSLPVGTMPPEGWPVILYAHGTGGNYKSFIRDGSAKTAARVTDAAGQVIEQFAMVSIDQVLHGTRVPANTDVELAFFNLFNIPAARANVKQGALDDFQLLRLVKSVDTMTPDGKPLKFNPAKIYFKGHSQGGLTGPLFLSAEPEVKAAILSGAGGFLIEALLSKTEPIDIPAVVEQFLGEPVDVFHPLLSLAQTYLEDADPINYAPLLFRSPPPGLPPKSIFQSLGLIDNYAPVPTIEALALSTGVQPVRPTLQEIPNLDVAGLSWTDAPVQGNVAGGAATGVLLQYKQKGRADGHFVIFDIPAAVAQSDRFLATHSKSGLATLLPP